MMHKYSIVKIQNIVKSSQVYFCNIINECDLNVTFNIHSVKRRLEVGVSFVQFFFAIYLQIDFFSSKKCVLGYNAKKWSCVYDPSFLRLAHFPAKNGRVVNHEVFSGTKPRNLGE